MITSLDEILLFQYISSFNHLSSAQQRAKILPTHDFISLFIHPFLSWSKEHWTLNPGLFDMFPLAQIKRSNNHKNSIKKMFKVRQFMLDQTPPVTYASSSIHPDQASLLKKCQTNIHLIVSSVSHKFFTKLTISFLVS